MRNWAMLKIKILIVVLLFLFVAYGLYSMSDSLKPQNLDEHVTHWRQIVADELPIGSTKESILSWGKQHKVEFMQLTETRLYAPHLEKVPVGWPGLPCWEWNIVIDIALGENGLSTQQRIFPVGSCI
jgi:hypothetical protein